MIRELRTFEFTCDECGWTEVVHQMDESIPPEGWSYNGKGRIVGPKGFTRLGHHFCKHCFETYLYARLERERLKRLKRSQEVDRTG